MSRGSVRQIGYCILRGPSSSKSSLTNGSLVGPADRGGKETISRKDAKGKKRFTAESPSSGSPIETSVYQKGSIPTSGWLQLKKRAALPITPVKFHRAVLGVWDEWTGHGRSVSART
jgi:hypothetical protein